MAAKRPRGERAGGETSHPPQDEFPSMNNRVDAQKGICSSIVYLFLLTYNF
jgi:hypothetical protein